MTFKDRMVSEGKGLGTSLLTLIKWLLLAGITGIAVGLVGVLMVKGINLATSLRGKYPWLLFLMPVAGLLTVFLYKVTKRDHDTGTNAVLGAIRDQKTIHLRTTPLIIISTILTHLVGGSAGREGAALQFGGSMGEALSKLLKFDQKGKTTFIMCGMSAAFSAVFGVPLAAVIFPMEVASVGVMYYSALVPCTISSFVAHEVAKFFGLEGENYVLPQMEPASAYGIFTVVILSILGAILSMIFCEAMHSTSHILNEKIKNKYIRILIGSAVLIGLTLLCGTDYNGTGVQVIVRAVEEGEAVPWAFILKLVFTVITLSVGFKGGEIVPSFFIGATFGALIGNLLGFCPGFCAAAGLISVFCGVTNCPVASFLIACELFGFEHAAYYLIVVGITYLISGYKSLYSAQKIVYSKTRPEYLNKDAE